MSVHRSLDIKNAIPLGTKTAYVSQSEELVLSSENTRKPSENLTNFRHQFDVILSACLACPLTRTVGSSTNNQCACMTRNTVL